MTWAELVVQDSNDWALVDGGKSLGARKAVLATSVGHIGWELTIPIMKKICRDGIHEMVLAEYPCSIFV